MHSITFIVPLKLDCEGTEVIPSAAERNDTADEEEGEVEEAAEVIQSPVPRDIENGDEENETADQQRESDESSHPPNNEGSSLQHCGIPLEPTQALSSELSSTEATPADSPDQKTLHASTLTRSQRRAARHQRQLMQDLIDDELI